MQKEGSSRFPSSSDCVISTSLKIEHHLQFRELHLILFIFWSSVTEGTFIHISMVYKVKCQVGLSFYKCLKVSRNYSKFQKLNKIKILFSWLKMLWSLLVCHFLQNQYWWKRSRNMEFLAIFGNVSTLVFLLKVCLQIKSFCHGTLLK